MLKKRHVWIVEARQIWFGDDDWSPVLGFISRANPGTIYPSTYLDRATAREYAQKMQDENEFNSEELIIRYRAAKYERTE